MPWPRAIARLNKRYTNRFIEPVVRRFPGFAIVTHAGRRSGNPYRTPIYAFDSGDGLVVALTYGINADWAQNVMAGGGAVRRGGSERFIEDATIVGRPEAWPHLPFVVRGTLRVLRVNDFMHLRLA